MAEPADDDLYPAAFRLARIYALLSPRVLARELAIDRARAERLLDEMERRGAVGPPVIRATGARESLVNIVEDRPPGGADALLTATDPRVGRQLVITAVLAGAVGLLLQALLAWVGAGEAISGWFGVPIGSPVLAAVIVAVTPIAGLGIGWLLELPFRPEEDMAPAGALAARAAIWRIATLVGVGHVLLRLLS